MYKQLGKLFFIILTLAWPATVVLAEDWKGIAPGVSTRSNVVSLFQNCVDPTLPCEFDLNGEGVRIVFSGMVQDHFYECSNNLSDDTVLLVEVTPKLPIPMRTYERRYRLKRLGKTSEFSGYVDERAGIVLKARNSKIIQLNFIAASRDSVRCKAYYEDPIRFVAIATHCPPISLEGPAEAVTAGEILNFRARVQPDPKMTLIWTVSAGRIISRSGDKMALETSGLAGQQIKVTVEGRGSCSVENSLTLQIRSQASIPAP